MNKTLTTKSIELTLSNVEAELQLECQRVRDEIQAYEKFAKQLNSIPVIETPQVATSQPARFDSNLSVGRNMGIKELFDLCLYFLYLVSYHKVKQTLNNRR